MNALENASSADVRKRAEFGEDIVDLEDQLARVCKDENLVEGNVFTHIAERSERKADSLAASVLGLRNEMAAGSTLHRRTSKTGQGCREPLVPE